MPAATRQRRQVVDLPPLRLQTTEHQVETVCCPSLSAGHQRAVPARSREPIQYGSQLGALIVYLRTYQLLPSARTQELLADLFGVAPSEGTLDRLLGRAAAVLAPVVEQIRQGLVAAAVAHFDETGCYVEDARYWLHVACTAKLTYVFCPCQTRPAGMTAAAVLPAFPGVALHDAYASYWAYDCAHALCNVHLLRDLRFLVERYAQGWAQELIDLLRELRAATTAAQAAGVPRLPPSRSRPGAARYSW